MNDNVNNIFQCSGEITQTDRERLLHQKSCVIWFTGLSGSGKSTLAYALENLLIKNGYTAYVLDGDNIRSGINSDLSFNPEDRKENIRRISEIASLFANAGIITLVSFISPCNADRELARSIIEPNIFFEIYVNTPLPICEKRDSKGLYSKARNNIITNFTGIHSPYEIPDSPDISINTSSSNITKSITDLENLLIKNHII